MLGREVTVEWGGRPVQAWVPVPLVQLPALDSRASRAAAIAEGVLTADTGLDPRVLETAGRLLLRSEGAASSRIEAIDAPVGLVAVAVTSPTDVRGPAAWVGANLRAIDAALAHRGPLTVAGLHAGTSY